MDLLVEKLDGSRYYLSQYKVLITGFEESAPSVTRNSKQLNQRNGNIDFGGWHTGKTINITGYYRADDIDEEETLREKLYALLSDPDGYYITQLKTTPSVAMERPGETSGGYYDKLNNYLSHKRFLVYTEAPEMELVGNVNGTLLYKLTAEFKTMKLPYGESVPRDLDVKPITGNSAVGTNLLTGTDKNISITSHTTDRWSAWKNIDTGFSFEHGKMYTFSAEAKNSTDKIAEASIRVWDSSTNTEVGVYVFPADGKRHSVTFTIPNDSHDYHLFLYAGHAGIIPGVDVTTTYHHPKLEKGSLATDWCPNPADPGYKKWYIDTYYNTKNLAIPYAGTVPCNQLEQGFAIEFIAKESAISMSLKINDTKLTYSGTVADGDVFVFSGFSYTQNGLSIVSKTNKAYFILQPDKPNRITCNIHGTVKIIGFQNLYA